MGVDLFFVLSGFLITGILVDSREQAGYFKNFYMRRVLRIFPLYYGVLFLLLALTPLLQIQWHGIFPALLLYLQNLHQYNSFTSQMGPDISLNHLWSLAIEEQFYFLWPLLVFFARTRKRVLLFALTGSALALLFRLFLLYRWNDWYTTHHSMFARADALLLGAALAMLYRSDAWETVLKWSPWIAIGMGGTVVLSLLFGSEPMLQSQFWVHGFRYSPAAIAFCGLLAWALRPGWLADVLSLRVLRFFGKYSYGLYVLHMALLPVVTRALREAFFRLYPSKELAVVGTAIIVLALSSGAAYASFHLYEKRFLRLKRFFDYPARARPVS